MWLQRFSGVFMLMCMCVREREKQASRSWSGRNVLIQEQQKWQVRKGGEEGRAPKAREEKGGQCASSGSSCNTPGCPQSQGGASWSQSPEWALPPMLDRAFLQDAADAWLSAQALGQPSCREEVGTNLPSSQIVCGSEVTGGIWLLNEMYNCFFCSLFTLLLLFQILPSCLLVLFFLNFVCKKVVLELSDKFQLFQRISGGCGHAPSPTTAKCWLWGMVMLEGKAHF